MELWIRSQDKMKLVKVNYLYIMDQQDHFTIIGETIDSGPIVGTYKSKDRAEEVLDEIQKKINLINLGPDFGSPMIDLKNPTYIYEMPID